MGIAGFIGVIGMFSLALSTVPEAAKTQKHSSTPDRKNQIQLCNVRCLAVQNPKALKLAVGLVLIWAILPGGVPASKLLFTRQLGHHSQPLTLHPRNPNPTQVLNRALAIIKRT